MSQKPSQNFDYDLIADGYYDMVFHRCRGVQSKWHHMKFARVRDEMGACSRHLDVGCGPGTFIGSLSSSLLSVGYDISETQIKYASDRYGGDNRSFVHSCGDGLPFDDEMFDIVTAIELIEHLPERGATSLPREMHRVLKPAGRIIVTTPNYGSLWPLLERLLSHIGSYDYAEQHNNRFDNVRLRHEMEASGMHDVKVEAFMGLAPFTAAFGWAVPEAIRKMEPASWVSRFGFLLVATGTKSG